MKYNPELKYQIEQWPPKAFTCYQVHTDSLARAVRHLIIRVNLYPLTSATISLNDRVIGQWDAQLQQYCWQGELNDSEWQVWINQILIEQVRIGK